MWWKVVMEGIFCDALEFFGVCLVLLTCRSMSKSNPLDRESYVFYIRVRV